MKSESTNPILLFDGVCNLCDGFVQAVISRDHMKKISYISLQSEAGQALLEKSGLPADLDSVVLVEGTKVFTKSDVAFRIFHHLGAGWRLLSYLSIIPRFIRDTVYDWIAKNRYRWFGKKTTCMIPRPEWKDRFIE